MSGLEDGTVEITEQKQIALKKDPQKPAEK